MADIVARLRQALSDRYEIECELGRGGMATVYLATDLKHNREVALKVLHPELAASVGHDRFLREIEIVAGLTHPRILTLIDSGEANGLLFYVMPYVEGETLKDRLEREGALPVEESLRIAREVADALVYAHEKGVIHRDIKPSNILFEAGHAVIADFGVARAVGVAGEGDATATGMAVGTPKYMSPEQAAAGEVDGRTDVYALGCVLWEMLAGDAPFEAPTPHAMLALKSSDSTPSLRGRRRSVPVEVEGVIAKAMAPQAADRYRTAREFERALAEPETAEKLRPRRRREARTRAVAGVVIVALVGIAAWWLLGRGVQEAGASDFLSVAVLPVENASGDPDQEPFVVGQHQALIGQLGRIGSLRLISRRSVLKYADSDLSIPEIAEELGVDYLVEASAARDGDRVRIGVNLIRAVPQERQLWTRAFDGDASEILSLHGDVARGIAEALDVDLSPEMEAKLAGTRPVNPQTYEAYLRGMQDLGKGTPADFERGMRYLTEAVEADPGDALAWSGLVDGYVTLGHGPAPPEGVWQSARAAVDRALRLDPDLPEGHAALARVLSYGEWRWEEAEREYRRANELNPSMAENHYHYAWFLALFERWEEAVEEHELAQQLDPLSPLMSGWMLSMYEQAGLHERALAAAEHARGRWPDNPAVLLSVGTVLLADGQVDEAVAAHEAMAAVNPMLAGWLANTYARAGRETEARALIAEIESQPLTGWNALNLGRVYATLGDLDRAFELLAFEPSHCWLPWTRSRLFAGALHEDPRFAELMDRVHLPMPEVK